MYYKNEKDNTELEYNFIKNISIEEFELNISNNMKEDNITDNTKVEFGLNTLVLEHVVNSNLEDPFTVDEIINGIEKSDGSYCKIIDVKFLKNLSNDLKGLSIPSNEYGVDALYVDKTDSKNISANFFSYKVPQSQNRNKTLEQKTLSDTISLLKSFETAEEISGNEHLESVRKMIQKCYDDGIQITINFYMIHLGKKYDHSMKTYIDTIVSDDLVGNLYVYSLEEIGAIFKSIGEKSIDVKNINFKKHEVLFSDTDQDNLLLVLPFHKMTELFKIEKNENNEYKIPDNLFSSNVRKFLDTNTNYNRGMFETLKTIEGKKDFYKYNNGITVVCDELKRNDYLLRSTPYKENKYVMECDIKNLRVVNGAQTISTLVKVLNDNEDADLDFDESGFKIMIRLFDTKRNELVSNAISRYTNSQNPINDIDLRSLEKVHYYLKENIRNVDDSFVYLHKRGSKIDINKLKKQNKKVITMADIGNILWVVKDPVAARSQKNKLWKYNDDSSKDLHDQIFHTELNGYDIIRLWSLNEKILEISKEIKKEGSKVVMYITDHVLYEIEKRKILLEDLNFENYVREAFERNILNFNEYSKKQKNGIYLERKYFQSLESKEKVDDYIKSISEENKNEN